jgi:hypothetical protein
MDSRFVQSLRGRTPTTNRDVRRKVPRMLEFATENELADYVRDVLLRKGDFDESIPMVEAPILRNGAPVGIEYTLLAPRSMKLSAIWSASENRILFYDADTTRFQTIAAIGPVVNPLAEPPRRPPV